MPVHYTVLARNTGFFSNVNGLLNRLRFMEDDDACTVYWNVRRLKMSDNDEHRQSPLGPFAAQSAFPYGTEEDENVWESFFQPIDKPERPGREYESRYIWNAHAPDGSYFDGERRWAGASLSMYVSDFAWRETYHRLWTRYIRLRDEVCARVDTFAPRIRRSPTIAVHLRDPSHFVEQPGRRRFGAADFLDAMTQYPDHQFFVATDQQHLLDAAIERFGDRVLYQENAIRRPPEQRRRQLHHRDGAEASRRFGEDVLTDVLLMAQCETLVHVISNLAAAVGYINPALRFHYVGPRDPESPAPVKRAWAKPEIEAG